jgi:hypothetical protein
MPGKQDQLRITRLDNHSWGLNVKVPELHNRLGEARIADNLHRDTLYGLQKRKGNTLRETLEPNQRVTGIFDYQTIVPTETEDAEDLSGTAYEGESGKAIHQHLYALENGDLWVDQEDGDAFRANGFFDTLADNKFTTFAQANGHVYIGQPNGRITVWDGFNRWYAGITAPADIPTGSSGGSGVLNGKYELVVTHIYKTRDGRTIESNPSERSAEVSVTNKKINWSWTQVQEFENGERISGYRLYRRVSTASGDNDFFFLTEIDDLTVTTYEDNTPTIELTTLVALDHDIPPTGGQVGFYNQMLFVLGPDGAPHRINHSPPGNYEYFPGTHKLETYSASTSPIVGAKELNGVFVTFFEDGVAHVTGTSVSTLRIRFMTRNIGCVSPGSIQDLGEAIMFLWKDGLYGWDLTRPRQFGQNIEPLVEGLDRINLRRSYSMVYRELDHYYLALPGEDDTTTWLVFDYVNEALVSNDQDSRAREVPRAWFRYTGRNNFLAATAMASCFEFGTKRELGLWGNASAQIFQANSGLTDNGLPIDFHYRAYILPREIGRDLSAALTYRTIYRHWVTFYDLWEGSATFGYGVFDHDWVSDDTDETPYDGRTELLHEETYTRSTSRLGAVRTEMAHAGTGFFIDIKHSDEGDFRILLHEFSWRYHDFAVHRAHPEA